MLFQIENLKKKFIQKIFKGLSLCGKKISKSIIMANTMQQAKIF